jgi:hypothetical protein
MEKAILSDHHTSLPFYHDDSHRRAIQKVTHVEVEDNSGGCGEKYSVLIVSKVL